MFIRTYDGTLVNLDHFSRILTVPRKDDTADVLAKAPNGDYAHLVVGIPMEVADGYLETLGRLLRAHDLSTTAQRRQACEEVPA